MIPGSYTVTWGPVAGYNIPPPQTQIVAANGTATFTGIWIQQPGTIIIDPNPNSLNAPWTITGPSGFSQTGNGDLTLTNRLPGSYTVTWGLVTTLGHAAAPTRPSPHTLRDLTSSRTFSNPTSERTLDHPGPSAPSGHGDL